MRWSAAWHEFVRDRYIQVTVVLAISLVGLAVVGPFLVGDPQFGDITNRLAAPNWLGGSGGFLGTDELGRSNFTRIVFGLRTSYAVGITAVLVGAVLGTSLGLISGYSGGAFESLVMRIVDLQLSLPGLLLAMTVMVVSGGGLLVLILVLGLTSWTLYARVARNLVLRSRSTDFVAATRSLGAGPVRIICRHLLPNAFGPLVAIATIEFARLMLAEAALSFLGFGVQPPTISLGAIMAGGQDYLATEWWITAFAGLTLALAVLTFNVLGSWLQRVSDPTNDLGQEAAVPIAAASVGLPGS